jgi:hypothetical protein
MAKKKRRSSGAGLSGAEKQEQRQKRLEEKRRQREEALERRMKAQRRERLVRIGLLSLLAVGAVWFFFLRTKPPTEIGGHELLSSSQAGEGQHTDDPVEYDTVPPVSGAHSDQPAPCGVFAEQIPDENQVHTLEHGAVGLLYEPDLDIQEIRSLESIVGEYESHVFSSPYEGMGSPIVIDAWGFRMPLEEIDAPAIREFIDEFRQKGPEEKDCPMQSDTPFEAEGPDDQPSPEATSQPPAGDDEEGTPAPDES